jgi:RNA methyltransferase, TrmH family
LASAPRPGVAPFTVRTPRVVAARRLHRRRERDETGRFLAEGPQAVREALLFDRVIEVFATADAFERYPELTRDASAVTGDALAALAETVAPQGIVAVCAIRDVPLTPSPLTVVLAGIRDPGNAGTVLRTADAAGAGTVVFAGDAVDPYNGKCVRASAGSLFHLDVVRTPTVALEPLRDNGLQVFAADPYGDCDLDDLADAGTLAAPTAWLFGSEAHGLPDELSRAADHRVRVPLYGRAESLNLAAAAAVCLYASARAARSSPRETAT